MKKIIPIVVIVVLLIGGVAVLKIRKHALEAAKPPKVLAVRVDGIRLETAEITLTLPVLAEVRSERNATVSTKVMGNVTAVYKSEGDRVKAGDLIARIDDRELKDKKSALKLKLPNIDYEIDSQKAQIESSKISLKNTIETHKRTQELFNVKGASIEQFQNEESAISSLRSKLKTAENGLLALYNQRSITKKNINEIESSLSYTLISSPVDGTISAAFVSEGEIAVPGKALFSISSDEGNYLAVHLPAGIEPVSLKVGQETVRLSSLDMADQNGLRQYRAQIPKGLRFVSGEIVDASLVVFSGRAALVPLDSILSREGKQMVFVYENGKISIISVHILKSGKEGAVLDVPLEGKILIVAKPDILLRLLTGVPVKVSVI
jgi:multidrug efflux pump subunit AcrA (membrane-fusion protein)